MKSVSPASHRVDEAFVVDPEGVFVAVVVPDAGVAEGVGVALDRADDVVAFEVGRVVEGAGGGFAAVEPEGGGVAADGAEAARVVEGDVVGAEAAHRDAADREPLRDRSPKRRTTSGITSSIT